MSQNPKAADEALRQVAEKAIASDQDLANVVTFTRRLLGSRP